MAEADFTAPPEATPRRSAAVKAAQNLGMSEFDWYNNVSSELGKLVALLDVVCGENFEDLGRESQAWLYQLAHDAANKTQRTFHGMRRETSDLESS